MTNTELEMASIWKLHPGTIQVVLDDKQPELPDFYLNQNSTLVLNLESINLVRLSNQHNGPIRWICMRDPRELVGPILDHFRGTYYLKQANQIVYSGDQDFESYRLLQGTQVTSQLLAFVCASRESGMTYEAVQAKIQEFSKPSERENFNEQLEAN